MTLHPEPPNFLNINQLRVLEEVRRLGADYRVIESAKELKRFVACAQGLQGTNDADITGNSSWTCSTMHYNPCDGTVAYAQGLQGTNNTDIGRVDVS